MWRAPQEFFKGRNVLDPFGSGGIDPGARLKDVSQVLIVSMRSAWRVGV
jgi:hypothetical protein